MADLASSIAKARKAGYSDADIAAYIANDSGMGSKVKQARQAGYSDAEIVAHLGKPNAAKDVAKSGVAGLVGSVLGLVDTAAAATPFGAPANALNLMAGQRPGVQNALSVSRLIAPRLSKAARYEPLTGAGQVARTAGAMAPNALAPGNAVQRAANVVLPTAGAEAAAGVTRAFGGDEKAQDVARVVGGLVGAGGASVRLGARRPPPSPVQALGERTRQDPAAMRARAADMRAAGAQPTLVDVSGERGRRFVRAVGVRSDAAGEALTANARSTTAAVKPSAMSATRRLTPDQRTAEQFANDTEAAREAQARRNYSEFDAEQIEIPDTVLDMLSDSSGRSIIARARADAIENQDWGRQVELDRLLQLPSQGGVGPLPRISAGTVDRLVIAARERGRGFASSGRNYRARGAFGRRDQLDATLDNVEGLRPARQAYSTQSRAIEVARGENYRDPLTTDPADYAAWLQSLPEEARQANQVAVRQQLLDTLGRQPENRFGTLDALASSPYARENLRATFGADADQYLAQIGTRVEQARNAQFVQPNAGSRTAVLENDVGNVAQQTVGAVRQGLSGDLIGLAARAVDAWRRRGFNPAQADELARIATDASQTDAAINAIATRLEPQARQQFLQLRNAAITGSLAGNALAAASQAPQR
jgi:hypothetical protein